MKNGQFLVQELAALLQKDSLGLLVVTQAGLVQ